MHMHTTHACLYTQSGKTALHKAAYKGYIPAVQLLLQFGADSNAPCHVIIDMCQHSCVVYKLLLLLFDVM